MIAVLSEGPGLDVGSAESQGPCQFSAKTQGVRLRTGTDHPMASHRIRKDLNTHFHGIGLHDHHRCGTGWTADCLCVLLEHQTVLGTELRAVCRLRGVRAEGSAVEPPADVRSGRRLQ